MSVIKGQSGAIPVGARRRYVPGQGWTTVYRYEFALQSDASSFGAAAASSGNDNVDIDEKGPPYAVEVSSATLDPSQPDTSYVDRWEIVPIDNDLAIWEHPLFQGLSTTLQTTLRKYYKNSGDDDAYTTATNEISNAGGSANATDFLALLAKGTDHYQNFATAVRYTRTIGDGYTNLGGTYDSVGKIWTSAQVIAEGAPGLYASAITAAESALQSPAAGYYGGWLKKQPTITQRGTGRSDIVHEWVLANWSTTLYDFA